MDGKKFFWPKRPNLANLYAEANKELFEGLREYQRNAEFPVYTEIIQEDEQLPEEQERRRRFWAELTSEEWLAEWAKTREDIRFRIAMTGMK